MFTRSKVNPIPEFDIQLRLPNALNLNALEIETLFVFFYNHTHLRERIAKALTRRGWSFDNLRQVWLKKGTTKKPVVDSDFGENGVYQIYLPLSNKIVAQWLEFSPNQDNRSKYAGTVDTRGTQTVSPKSALVEKVSDKNLPTPMEPSPFNLNNNWKQPGVLQFQNGQTFSFDSGDHLIGQRKYEFSSASEMYCCSCLPGDPACKYSQVQPRGHGMPYINGPYVEMAQKMAYGTISGAGGMTYGTMAGAGGMTYGTMAGARGMTYGTMAGDLTHGKIAGDMTHGTMARDMTYGTMAGDMTHGTMAGDMTYGTMAGNMSYGTMAGDMTQGTIARVHIPSGQRNVAPVGGFGYPYAHEDYQVNLPYRYGNEELRKFLITNGFLTKEFDDGPMGPFGVYQPKAQR